MRFRISASAFRKGVAWTMAIVLVGSLLVWYFTRDTLPSRISLTTGATGGLYHGFGRAFAAAFEARNRRTVDVLASRGSVENHERLLQGRATVGILQGGAVSLDRLSVMAPLYHEVVHVIVREGRGIDEIPQLAGRRVAIGPPGSGMRESALKILRHYRLEDRIEEPEEPYFTSLLQDETIDAAIVTTGVLNPDLQRVLGGGGFRVLPVDDADAVLIKHAYVRRFTIPRGLYGEQPRVPSSPVTTVATTAFLVVPSGTSELLATEILRTTYESGLWLELPTLIPSVEAKEWNQLPLHPIARRYFNPSDDVARLAAIMESVAAVKELTFALIAGLYLAWDRWRRVKEREREREIQRAKDRLDQFLEKTLVIERAQMHTGAPVELKQMLDQVTRIKLEALEELAHEELRSDQSFMIFLAQCANLINKIQAKIAMASGPGRSAPSLKE